MYELIARNILRQFRIGKCYSGYEYVVHAIELMCFDERFSTCLTKVLYITIAENYKTSSLCVEKNIRRVIQVIWDNPDNEELIRKYFGVIYMHTKPSNKEFLGLLYEYVKSYNLLENIFRIDKIMCPISREACGVYANLVDTLRNLQ